MLMTSRVVVMVDVTAVVWAMGVLVTDTSPKYSCLLRYSTCDSTMLMTQLPDRRVCWGFGPGLPNAHLEMSDTAPSRHTDHVTRSTNMNMSWLAALS